MLSLYFEQMWFSLGRTVKNVHTTLFKNFNFNLPTVGSPFWSPEPPFLLVTWSEKRSFLSLRTSGSGEENGGSLG